MVLLSIRALADDMAKRTGTATPCVAEIARYFGIKDHKTAKRYLVEGGVIYIQTGKQQRFHVTDVAECMLARNGAGIRKRVGK